MDKIITSITNILNIDDEILTKFLGYLHPMTVPKKTILIRPLITDENVYITIVRQKFAKPKRLWQ